VLLASTMTARGAEKFVAGLSLVDEAVNAFTAGGCL
jgi:hypothetical protein